LKIQKYSDTIKKERTKRGGTEMTELKLEFELENAELPIDYDKVILSFMKAAIENFSPDLFDRLYNKRESVMKTYCWTCYLPHAQFTSDTIKLGANKFMLTFSDIDMGELLIFFNAFSLMKHKIFHMNRNSMKLLSVKTRKLQTIKETELIVKMQSSLIARKHNSDDNTDVYYTFDEPEFSDIVKENLKIFLQRINIECDTSDFSIVPLKGKKVVTRTMGQFVDGNIGIYKITGNLRLLEILYAAGIGTRRSAGHGKFEIIF
jgi:CRISPR-associated endoribonuclease Cas6